MMQTTQLKTAQLGQTGLEITRVGFGAWAIGGGGWEFGWGPQEDAQSLAAIDQAPELGVNWIDTAAAYGLGHSETVVGRALHGLIDRPYVFTKASLLQGPGRRVVHSLKRDSILREAQASLERLGIDAIDLYQIHWPIPNEDIDEGWAALAELKQQGLVRHIGVSNFDVQQLRRIQQVAPVETLQPQYSLIERDVERKVLPFAEQEGIGVIVYSPMGSGLLTGRMTRERIAGCPTMTGASTIHGSSSPRSRAISTSSTASRPWPTATTPSREPWPSLGRFATLRWPARSSASARPTRSIL
jgi:aryl-alcohol dehydrogenase-like predicted oxidoreductase